LDFGYNKNDLHKQVQKERNNLLSFSQNKESLQFGGKPENAIGITSIHNLVTHATKTKLQLGNLMKILWLLKLNLQFGNHNNNAL